MPSLKLSFNQKVALGFAIILGLITFSGGMSLWTLTDISNSNDRVHETAVPVVTEVNKAQISLLKLANLSALGFNALSEDDILSYRKDFDAGAQEFSTNFGKLETLVVNDPQRAELVGAIKADYEAYKVAVGEMFSAKLAALGAEQRMLDEVAVVTERADDVGFALMEIVNARAPSRDKEADLQLAQGFANQADALLAGVAKAAQEMQNTKNVETLATAEDDLEFIINGAMLWFDKAVPLFEPMDQDGIVIMTRESVAKLRERLQSQPNFVTHKREQLQQQEVSWAALNTSKASVQKAVAGLDSVLVSADAQFTRLQQELADSVSFGFKSTIVILLVLLALATQNFNSMRQAIRKKMIDLAKLNGIGGTLAAARDQDTALELVLHAMYDKIGIESGSVYLFNKDNDLEAKAFLPPKQMDDAPTALTFVMGEGIIGKAAESKQAIFVPDTSSSSDYIGGENEKAKALLCVPLVDKDILIGVMNFSGDVNKVAFADSDYEFVASVARSLVTTIKNIRMVEVIEEHNRTLEKKVEERTAALKQKNEDIANMFSNMHQGLFTIVEGGQIHPEYAAYLETIFETKNVANRHFVDFMFSHSNLSSDIVDAASTAVTSIIGEDSMMYEFNSHLLVKELAIALPDKPLKQIELDWDPIIDDQDVVTKLMVTVRDVTALKVLQAEAEGQKQELMIIGEILSVDTDKFSDFIAGSADLVGKCRTIIEGTEQRDLSKLAELFRNIHTVKGNARTYGLKHITDTVHRIENTFDQLRKNDEMQWQPGELLDELAFAEQAIKVYSGIFKDKLGRDGNQGIAGAQVDRERIAKLMANIASLPSSQLPEEVMHIIRDTFHSLVTIDAEPMTEVIADVLKSIESLAGELGKPVPTIEIRDHNVYTRKEAHGMLNNIFMHVMRNAIDHGIESPQERQDKGKPAQGQIQINAVEKDGAVSFAIRDDGRGIAIGRIFQKAIDLGIYAPGSTRPAAQEVANLIFASGFSTAEQITEISGRGVGMDAVKKFLEEEGGRIELVLDSGNEADDYRGFTTHIHLPAKLCIVPPTFASAA
jgi:putative methionine-R-sulfoxide reductase with GAF domain/CHASE3 domain sensor protein/HPt (histidine-containing phosphotransfer) domain-containing protein